LFSKIIYNPSITQAINEDEANIRVFCKNVKDSLKILKYSIDKSLIQTLVDFKYKKEFSANNSSYKIDLLFIVNKKMLSHVKESELKVEIKIRKNLKYKILNFSTKEYNFNEDKGIISFNQKNFCSKERFGLKLIFEANEENLIEEIKLNYIYYVKINFIFILF
jgi:hypothetical protein